MLSDSKYNKISQNIPNQNIYLKTSKIQNIQNTKHIQLKWTPGHNIKGIFHQTQNNKIIHKLCNN